MMLKYFNEKDDPKMIGVSKKLMLMLDNARNFARVPFIITSGVRSLEENIRVGGVEDSAHLYGLAVDLRCDTSRTRYKMLFGLFGAGFKRIEIGRTHIHVDIDDTKDQDVAFLESLHNH
jgi:hypothetical protein